MNLKIGFISLGCPKNLTDTEVMIGLLKQKDYEITNNEYDADIIIVNTCAFINDAKEESIEEILNSAERKKDSKCKKLIVCGCLSERYREEIFKEIPEVDAVIGTGDYENIVDIIDDLSDNKKIIKYGNINHISKSDELRVLTTPKYVSYLKIAEGCNNCCTYCIIPKLRGRYRSRSIESIINEAQKLSDKGVKELILIAQDTTFYGNDIYKHKSLHILLDKLCRIDKLEWIRIQYMYPENLYDELIDIIKNESKICNYFDMPIQHCSDRILKKMGRNSTKQLLLSLIHKIKKKIPNAVFRTSLIVGFPGETDKDFNELVDFVKEVKFDRLGVFKYSQEEDTVAAEYDNQIPELIKEQRYNELMFIQNGIVNENNHKKIGQIYKVLVEGYSNNIGMYYGRTYQDSIDIDSKVYFKSESSLKTGNFIKVKIIDFNNYDLIGEIYYESCK